MNIAKIWAKTRTVWQGHIVNWFWRSRAHRHDVRTAVLARLVPEYLKRYLPAAAAISERAVVHDDEHEKIFTIWLQGEEVAPDLVKACFRSIRRHCKQELIVLDEHSVFDYITLPKEIIDKYRAGKISRAHFADICRVELLYEHGGIWMDSTCFVTGPIPDWIIKEDFFVYMYGRGHYEYSFMQNCWIRARRGAYLLDAWRAMIIDYWMREDSIFDYFMHQLMFKTLIQNDLRAIKYFEKMPHVNQGPTHALWWAYGDKPFDKKIFDEITSKTFWQKTTPKHYKVIPRGSFADVMINKM